MAKWWQQRAVEYQKYILERDDYDDRVKASIILNREENLLLVSLLSTAIELLEKIFYILLMILGVSAFCVVKFFGYL